MNDGQTPLLAGVELGGTKIICILGTGPEDVRERVELPTGAPDATLAAIADVLARWDYAALGIGTFGPVDLDPASPTYGFITNTPKPGWQGTPLLGLASGRPVAIDTDVNGAALAEGLWGGAQGLTSWAYITVGTGIGVGSIVAGQPLRGLGHSEAGHVRVSRVPGDSFPGTCPFHGDCVEGLANGPSIEARAGMRGRDIPLDHEAWAFAADALAILCHGLVFTSLPQRILMGGGVAMGQPQMLPMIRARLIESLNGYSAAAQIADRMDDYLVHPALGADAGPLGALALAQQALARSAN
ncbi:ROK family protein [Sphingobium phenoxybenzoativorans]|uniref:ROK family protein n=1 Tax=Sphingobium phenoxybenzoativorans TaxID=1592790 RepID=UPI00087299F2|nr:ROK family protein [Sphingobium phenoxybenzoativorans]